MCVICEEISEGRICDECMTQMEDNIAVKCVVCGSYGFIKPTEKNIARFKFFIPDFEKRLTECNVCVIPMNGCPDCVKSGEVPFGGSGGFTA